MPSIDRLADAVSALEVEVLVVQEIRRAQARRLARRLGWRRTWHRKHHPYSPAVWWRTEGMAVFSAHDLRGSRATSLTPDTSTWTYRHRIAVETTVVRGDGHHLHVIDLHLASDAVGSADRILQAGQVRRLLDDAPSPCIVAGDLNDHGEPHIVGLVGGNSHVDAWDHAARRSEGDGSTNPSHAPHQRLDHVLVPAGAADVQAEVPPGGGRWAELSDHLPLTVSFTLVT